MSRRIIQRMWTRVAVCDEMCISASFLVGQTVVNSVKMKLAYIPAGTFLMGSPPEEKGRQEEERQHRVTLTRAFRLGVAEVTQAQWKAVMGTPRGHFKGGVARDITEFSLYAVQHHDQVAGLVLPFFNECVDFRREHLFILSCRGHMFYPRLGFAASVIKS